MKNVNYNVYKRKNMKNEQIYIMKLINMSF